MAMDQAFMAVASVQNSNRLYPALSSAGSVLTSYQKYAAGFPGGIGATSLPLTDIRSGRSLPL